MTFIYYTEKEMERVRIIEKLVNKVITEDEACEALRRSVRTLYRRKADYKRDGPRGLLHGLRGKPSNNQVGKIDKYKKYACKKIYKDFGPTLLAETLENEVGWGKINPESLRLGMIRRGLRTTRKRKTTVKRTKRERREKYGMLVQFDGSYHDWLENGKSYCLLLAIDDATGKLIKGSFTKGESLEDILAFRKEYFVEHGKPQFLYVDRHSTYKVNHPQDQFDDEMITRFERGMRLLGVDIIFAKEAQGKGRVERSFKTLQDRLIKKMRLAGIKDIASAQEYFDNVYMPEHNKKYCVQAKQKGNAHSTFSQTDQERYERYFAKETKRSIRADGIVQYNKVKYQLQKGQQLFQGNKVVVRETAGGEIAIRSGKTILHIQRVIYPPG